MNLTSTFDIVSKIGGLTGLLLLVLKVVEYIKRPKLDISLKKYVNEFYYHDIQITRKFVRLKIENTKKKAAHKAVAVLTIKNIPVELFNLAEEYVLHWCDLPYRYLTNTPEPITIYHRPAMFVDVVFTAEDQEMPGCWVATQFALTDQSQPKGQFYLPAGEYTVEVEVFCENGRGDRKTYRLSSPKKWEGLDLDYLGPELIPIGPLINIIKVEP